MNDFYTKTEAVEVWGITKHALEKRLIRDIRAGRSMLGTRKSGAVYIISRAYMEDRYGKPKNES